MNARVYPYSSSRQIARDRKKAAVIAYRAWHNRALDEYLAQVNARIAASPPLPEMYLNIGTGPEIARLYAEWDKEDCVNAVD